jgi:RNA polymerase sigma-70 factor (ECF subfamily)
LGEPARLAQFEVAVLPHLDAAYNLARWLTRNEHDAEDVVQEAYLRALQFFEGFRGGDGRSWLLAIVRNTCYTWLERNRPPRPTTEFDEKIHSGDVAAESPTKLVLQIDNQEMVAQAIDELPPEFREVIVLRELEGLSYKEIGTIVQIPAGTVMSRLARARQRLQDRLAKRMSAGD